MNSKDIFHFWMEKKAGVLSSVVGGLKNLRPKAISSVIKSWTKDPIGGSLAGMGIPSQASKNFYENMAKETNVDSLRNWSKEMAKDTKTWGESGTMAKVLPTTFGLMTVNSLMDTPTIAGEVMAGKKGPLEALWGVGSTASMLLPIPGVAQLVPFAADLMGAGKFMKGIDNAIGFGTQKNNTKMLNDYNFAPNSFMS